MSKHCPSRATHCPERFPAREIAWQRRVFRNSYTRKGHRFWIKRWACKIQYQGQRRTFSLTARTRREAARQAQHLYQVLRTQGWDAAIKLQRKPLPEPAAATPALLSKEEADLTHREQEILHHVSKGCLDKEIADSLQISVWTVHNHLKNIYEKLTVHNRTEAVLKYLQK